MEPYNIHPQANPDGVRTEALVSIAVSLKRIADKLAEPADEVDFTSALAVANARFRQNPNWRKLEHTPWENDAPVIAATLMCEVLRRRRDG